MSLWNIQICIVSHCLAFIEQFFIHKFNPPEGCVPAGGPDSPPAPVPPATALPVPVPALPVPVPAVPVPAPALAGAGAPPGVPPPAGGACGGGSSLTSGIPYKQGSYGSFALQFQ